jgi:hypothetical protein
MGGAIAIVTSVVRDAMDPSRLWPFRATAADEVRIAVGQG